MLQISSGTASPFGQDTTCGFPRTHQRATSIGRGSDLIPASIMAFTKAPVPVLGLYFASILFPLVNCQNDSLRGFDVFAIGA